MTYLPIDPLKSLSGKMLDFFQVKVQGVSVVANAYGFKGRLSTLPELILPTSPESGCPSCWKFSTGAAG